MRQNLRRMIALLLMLFLFTGPNAHLEEQEAWMLTLVNSDHPLPEDYEVTDLVEVRGGQKVDRRIYPALQAMFDAARAAGLSVVVRSGYRTRKQQETLLVNRYKEYRNKGYSDQEAREAALSWVAYPGTSEHEAGLGLDINAGSGSSKEKVYAWLAKNAWKYGFILRYPNGTSEITGIIYEPWHYRYVGVDAATQIVKLGITFEEYYAYYVER